MVDFECDSCGKICETEDDHIVTEKGQYLCMKCYKEDTQGCRCWISHGDGDVEEIVQCPLCKAAPGLLKACGCALADLEGIMPIHEPGGERTHPAWATIKELMQAIAKAEGR